MELSEKQWAFARLVGELLLKAYALGFTVSLGEAYRPPETAAIYAKQGKGIKNSLHTKKIAIDLNLFKNGKYLDKAEDHKPLGEWWEEQSTDEYICRWGGNFSTRKDGNHYEII